MAIVGSSRVGSSRTGNPARKSNDGSNEKIVYRRAESNDAASVLALFKDWGAGPSTEAGVLHALGNFDPNRTLVWLALAGPRPVGMATLHVRHLGFAGRQVLAGYWASLYICEEFRGKMVYPRLSRAVFKGASEANMEFVYAGVRLPRVATAHERQGFQRVCDIPVMVKPLRPASMVASKLSWPRMLQSFTPPIDWLYGLGTRLLRRSQKPGRDYRKVNWGDSTDTSTDVESILDLLQQMSRSGEGLCSQQWTIARIRERFGDTPDGTSYQVRALFENDKPVAACVFTYATRQNIKLCVLIDLFGSNVMQSKLLSNLHWEAKQHAEAMLLLPPVNSVIAGSTKPIVPGYLSSNDSYALLVRPAATKQLDQRLLHPANWRYGFADHDAF